MCVTGIKFYNFTIFDFNLEYALKSRIRASGSSFDYFTHLQMIASLGRGSGYLRAQFTILSFFMEVYTEAENQGSC